MVVDVAGAARWAWGFKGSVTRLNVGLHPQSLTVVAEPAAGPVTGLRTGLYPQGLVVVVDEAATRRALLIERAPFHGRIDQPDRIT